MARLKRTSKILEMATQRLAGLKSIDPELDLGNGISVENYEKRIEKASASLERYNTSLSIVDQNEELLSADESDLKDFHERVLLGVGMKYGKNSNEYKMAGGVKKSERARRPAKSNSNPTS